MKCSAVLAAFVVVSTQPLHSSAVKFAASSDSAVESAAKANPIRKIVTLLQSMQKKIEAEGEKETALYNKYMCYCKTSGAGLEKSIADATTKVPVVTSAIQESVAEKAQLDESLKKHQVDRDAAKASMAEASAIREKEAKAYAGVKAEYDSNIAAIDGAVAALEKGVVGGFIQATAAQALRKIALQSSANLADTDRQALFAFLDQNQGAGYVPKSGEIIGILKELGDDMAKGLSEETETEEAAIKLYEELMSAKTKEVGSLTEAIEEKSVRTGEVAVAIAHAKNDLSDTEAALLDDKQFLADLEKNCATKESEWAEISKTRSEEVVAIAQTIQILQDDDALELFKKTLPSAASASFVQMRSRASGLSARALAILRSAHAKKDAPMKHQLDFIALALHGKKIGFDKVIKMIDDMVAMLKSEQVDDDGKKAYCAKEIDSADDAKKGFEIAVSDAETAMEEAEESISTLVGDIKALEASIAALDKTVAEAAEQRKNEHESYVELLAQNNAAKKLLALAKNRLNQFYNPSLYVAPTALVQIRAHQARFGKQPETFSAYKSKSQETAGVIEMLDMLVKDLDKENTEAETSEKDAQSDYETATADAAAKRAADLTSLTAKKEAKADTEVALQAHKDKKASSSKELMAKVEYISALHGECDWLLQYYDVRKDARASEMDSLANAKAVLRGSDYSMLVQVGSKSKGGRLRGVV